MNEVITRTITLDHVTPRELAVLFTNLFDDEQAEFFEEVGEIAREWPGADWCQQSCCIAGKLTDKGRVVIATLAGHALSSEQSHEA